MGTPAFYTVAEQQLGKALLEAYRTGKPLKTFHIRREFITRMVAMGVLDVHVCSLDTYKYTLNRDAFVKLVNVVPEDIYKKLTDPIERQKWSAQRRGYKSLEAYQNRKSIAASDAKKAAKRAPYRGTRSKVLESELPVSEDILFTGPVRKRYKKDGE